MSEEIMNEEELAEVAGGTWDQVARDADNIRWLERRYDVKLLPGNASAYDVNKAMNNIGAILSKHYNCNFKIGCELHTDGKGNSYHLNHHKMSQKEMWNAIYDRLGVENPNL